MFWPCFTLDSRKKRRRLLFTADEQRTKKDIWTLAHCCAIFLCNLGCEIHLDTCREDFMLKTNSACNILFGRDNCDDGGGEGGSDGCGDGDGGVGDGNGSGEIKARTTSLTLVTCLTLILAETEFSPSS